MAGTGLALAGETSSFDVLPQAYDLATKIAKTEFVPRDLRNRPEAVMACVLAGHEMGVGPMQSLAKIHVIEGRPAPSAELMRAVVLARGHEIWPEEQTATRVTLCGRRAGSDHTTKITWTMDDAQRAKLTGKNVWRSYPRAMLLARATGELVRSIFPDVVAGLSYAAEEVEDGFLDDAWTAEPEDDDAPPANLRSLPAKKATAKKAATTKKSATKKAKPAPQPPAAEDLPPLPGDDDVVDAEIVEPAAADQAETQRAQRIAMRARDLDLDHHEVVYAVTGGRQTSAKGLGDAEAEAVFEALRQIKVGEKVLDTTGEEPRLADPPDDGPPAAGGGDGLDLGDVEEWGADQWRAWLAERGGKVVATIQAAQRIAADAGLDSPGSLDDLRGTSLAALVAAWVEETTGGGR